MSRTARQKSRDRALRAIEFKKYSRLARSLLARASAIVVCDFNGERVWSLARGEKAVYVDPLAQLNSMVPDWPATGANIRRCSINGNSVYISSICDDVQRPVAGLFVLAEGDAQSEQGDIGAIDHSGLADGMQQLAALVGNEIQLLGELERMTDELAERYEELNLIYDTEDNVKYFDEGQDAIRNIVRNTVEYLNGSFCAIVMAEKNITVSQVNPDRPLGNIEQLLALTQSSIYDYIAYRKTMFVRNGRSSHRELVQEIPCKLLGCPIVDENDEMIGILMLANPENVRDFSSSDRKLLQVMARKAARVIQTSYDSLTGMMTRNGFEYHLETALYVVRYKHVAHCVLNINIDRLHVVNDTCGHHAGDELIKRVAEGLRGCLGPKDIVARVGGGEFALLLADSPQDKGEETAERIRRSVGQIEFTRENRRYPVSVSIGLAPMESNSESVLSVTSAAEVACAAAKDMGRDRVEVFRSDNTMFIKRKAQIHWLGKLHSALREDRFCLYSQPIVSVTGDPGMHTEILLRMEDEEEGILNPGVFLSSAERYNLMPAIDRWVVRNTLKMLVANLPRSMLSKHVWAINLSGQTVCDGNFMQFILEETKRAGIDPSSICFEITETAAVANIDQAGKFMEELKRLGFRFSLDDFGTGLSSFAYLKTLPVDYLKIDGAFAKEVATDPVAASMVGAISQIGREMGLKTIAEFVETAAVQDKIRELGVHYVQGWHVGKPRPLMDQLIELTSSLEQGSPTVSSPLSAIEERDDSELDDTVVRLQASN